MSFPPAINTRASETTQASNTNPNLEEQTVQVIPTNIFPCGQLTAASQEAAPPAPSLLPRRLDPLTSPLALLPKEVSLTATAGRRSLGSSSEIQSSDPVFAPELKILKKSTEQVFVISPKEVIFFDESKNRMRFLHLVESPPSDSLVEEFIYCSPKVRNRNSYGVPVLFDAAYVWKTLHGKVPIETQIQYSKIQSWGTHPSVVITNGISQLHIRVSSSKSGTFEDSFHFFSPWTEAQLISQTSNLKMLIPVSRLIDRDSEAITLYINDFLITMQLSILLEGLQTVEDRGKTLDNILQAISGEDRSILYKYLATTEMSVIAHEVFKKVARLLNPDLSKIENLFPIFEHPIEPEEWKIFLPILQNFTTTAQGNIPITKSNIFELKIQIAILKALEQAVRSRNPEAIYFLLTNFPFLKEPEFAQRNDKHNLVFVDSDGIQQTYFFTNQFYLAIRSGDYQCVKAFLSAGWDLRKKAGAKIINRLLIENEDFNTEQNRIWSPEKLLFHWRIFTLLLEYGLDLDLYIEGSSGIPFPMAETLFLNTDSEVKKFGLYLYQKGVRLTPPVIEKMKLELLEHPEYESELIDLLIKQDKATQSEIQCLRAPPAPEGSPDFLIGEMSRAKITLNKLLRRYTANPLIEDFKELEKIRELKKQVKKHLGSHTEDSLVRSVYQSFSLEYDAVVTNHYLLSKLRQVSQELRCYVNLRAQAAGAAMEAAEFTKTSLSPQVNALFTLWHPTARLISSNETRLEKTLNATNRSAQWSITRNNLLQYVAAMNSDSFLRDKQISCVHGTKLVPDMIKEMALIPAGMMDDYTKGALVQFSGEHCGSNKHRNKNHISCVKPGKDWSDLNQGNRWILTPTPMLVSEVYAKQIFGCGDIETVFNYEASKKRINWEYIVKSIFGENQISKKNLQQSCTDILRLKAWDPSHQEYLDPVLLEVRKALESTTTPGFYIEALKELEGALTVKIKFPLDAADRDLITHPIPIVFAWTNASPIPISQLEESCAGRSVEVMMEGIAIFGRDIQAAFVREEDIGIATNILHRTGVRVFPFQVAHAIETVRMIKGADIQEKGLVLSTDQEKLGLLLQEDILPFYGRPFAERPTYKDSRGLDHLVESPFWGKGFPSYATYKEAVEETRTVPRFIHGKMHAVRTSIAAQLWACVYGEIKGEALVLDRTLLAIAAAAHDAQRQDEREDHWDRESGEALQSYLASRDHPQETCQLYAHALIEKDPQEKTSTLQPLFTSDIQRIIHDADVLEIMRGLTERKNFESERLAVFAVGKEWEEKALAKVSEGDKAMLLHIQQKNIEIKTDLENIVKEWGDFIQITETAELKMLLEYTPSINYYTEVLKILKFLTNKGKLPVLNKFLNQELQQISGEPSLEVIEMLP